MNVRALILALSAFVAPQLATQSAFAITNFWIPATTTATYVGMVSGDAWAAHVRPAGCLWTKLGVGGLDDETWIQGTSSGESIIAVQSTTTVCNFSMSAVVLDGRKLVFWGNGGNDILSGGYRAGSLQGGDGADLMWSDKADNAQSGGNGNDYSSSGVSSAHLAGSNNDDALCALAPSNHVDAMEGGNGTDSACGTADFYSSVENNNTNCPAACALF